MWCNGHNMTLEFHFARVKNEFFVSWLDEWTQTNELLVSKDSTAADEMVCSLLLSLYFFFTVNDWHQHPALSVQVQHVGGSFSGNTSGDYTLIKTFWTSCIISANRCFWIFSLDLESAQKLKYKKHYLQFCCWQIRAVGTVSCHG